MRAPILRVCTIIGVTAAAMSVALGEEVQGKLLAHKGEVTIDGGPLQEKITPGQIIQTGDESIAAFAPVPSQILILGKNTTFQAKHLELITKDGKVARRESAGVLRAGYVQCSLWKPEEGSTSMRITVPWGTVEAVGTSWGTWVWDDKGQIAVYAGTVTQWINGVEVKLVRGQVAFIEGFNSIDGLYAGSKEPTQVQPTQNGSSELAANGEGDRTQGEGDNANGIDIIVRIVDLTIGRIIIVDSKGNKDSILIAPGDLDLLKTARERYQAGTSAFSASASTDDRIAFSNLLDQINVTMKKFMIATIPQILEDQLFPEWKSKELKVPIETASQSTPG